MTDIIICDWIRASDAADWCIKNLPPSGWQMAIDAFPKTRFKFSFADQTAASFVALKYL